MPHLADPYESGHASGAAHAAPGGSLRIRARLRCGTCRTWRILTNPGTPQVRHMPHLADPYESGHASGAAHAAHGGFLRIRARLRCGTCRTWRILMNPGTPQVRHM